MPRRTNTKPVYGAPVYTLGSGATPSIWGFLSQKETGIYGGQTTGAVAPEDIAAIVEAAKAAAETQCCIENAKYCEQMTTIDDYIQRLTNILAQLNNKQAVNVADKRLDIMKSDLRARIAASQ